MDALQVPSQTAANVPFTLSCKVAAKPAVNPVELLLLRYGQLLHCRMRVYMILAVAFSGDVQARIPPTHDPNPRVAVVVLGSQSWGNR